MQWRQGVACVLGVVTLAGAAACTPPAPTTQPPPSVAALTTDPAPAPAPAPATTSAPASGAGTNASSTRVHLTAAGDYGANVATTGAVLQALRATGSDGHFALGDLSYGSPGGEPSWCSFVTSRLGTGFPFEVLSGNHESSGTNGYIDRFASCLPNRLSGMVGTYARQYYVDLPRTAPLVRVVLISPGLTFPAATWSYAAGTPRYTWTAAAIDGARRAGIRWVVVAMHMPCLSMGRYGCSSGTDLQHLLVSKRVDLVLSGHEHLYQRTKQLRERSGCARIPVGSYAPACVVDADRSMVAGAGTVFATVGTGGVALRPITATDAERGYFATASGAGSNPTYGFADLRVTPDELRYSFVRGAGGSFTDSWVLRRTPTL
ncbi:metallophosphoesterase [Terrabacter sp. LjRoot27]|uniref:metallophosphoesterase n=1 Tax=Terrabacter sp. LjRoot27 TaxID=3342306 RepID=UPI003ECFED51